MNFSLDHIWLWSAVATGAFSLYIFALSIYRLYFHPLARYPGPVIAKLTDGYMLYHAWRGDRHLEFWRLHERYGKFVRFGPSSISVNSSTALKDIYGFRANVQKAEFYDAFVHPAPNTHNSRDKELHARKRRVLSQAFSESAIKGMERYILGNIRTFCEGLGELSRGNVDEKGWTVPRNMADWCNWLAMDILGDLCFGKAFHMLERNDNRYAIDLVGVAARRHLIVSVDRPNQLSRSLAFVQSFGCDNAVRDS
jgi:cytochrome P450